MEAESSALAACSGCPVRRGRAGSVVRTTTTRWWADLIGFAPDHGERSDTLGAGPPWRGTAPFRQSQELSRVPGTASDARLASRTDDPSAGPSVHPAFKPGLGRHVFSLTFHKGQSDRAGDGRPCTTHLLTPGRRTFGVRGPVASIAEPLRPGRARISVATDLCDCGWRVYGRVCQEPKGRLRADGSKPLALLCRLVNPLHDGHLRLAEGRAANHRAGGRVRMTRQTRTSRRDANRRSRNGMQPFAAVVQRALRLRPDVVGEGAMFPGAGDLVVGLPDTAARSRLCKRGFYGGERARESALAGLTCSGFAAF